jgi:two-component system chemotaxis response regulator CheB
MWRILIVENNPEVRARLLAACKALPTLRVVAITEDGEQATRLSNVLKPDAIVAAVALCAHDRFAVVQNIMSHSPTRILVYASGNKAYDLGLDRALGSGAMHVFTAPPVDDGVCHKLAQAISDLCVQDKPRGTAFEVEAPLGAPRTIGGNEPKVARPVVRALPLPARIVAIGASTGGPAAIEYLLRKWAKDFPLPVIVAQHMTTGFSRDLVRWLDTLGSLRVKLADDDEAPVAGTMYFAPDGMHIALADERLRLTTATPEEAEVPSVDRLFDSVSKALGASAIGVLLTGMGEDGARGLLNMSQAGARTVAQDRETSLVYGMPSAAHRLGAAQLVLGLSDIAEYLNDCARALRRGKK